MTDSIRLEQRHKYGADWDSELSYDDSYPSLAEPVDDVRARRCDRALEELPFDDREPFRLVVIANMTYRQAAEWLGWQLATGEPNGRRVYRRVERASAMLRLRLAGDGPAEELEDWEAA